MERIHNLGPACQIWNENEGDPSYLAVFLRQNIYFWKLTKQLPKLKKLEKQTVVKNALIFFLGGKLVLKCVPFIILIPKKKQKEKKGRVFFNSLMATSERIYLPLRVSAPESFQSPWKPERNQTASKFQIRDA